MFDLEAFDKAFAADEAIFGSWADWGDSWRRLSPRHWSDLKGSYEAPTDAFACTNDESDEGLTEIVTDGGYVGEAAAPDDTMDVEECVELAAGEEWLAGNPTHKTTRTVRQSLGDFATHGVVEDGLHTIQRRYAKKMVRSRIGTRRSK